MWGVSVNPSQLSTKKEQKQVNGGGLSGNFRPENFIPGLIIGFIFGLLLDLTTPFKGSSKKTFLPGKSQQELSVSCNGDSELKLEVNWLRILVDSVICNFNLKKVLVVRQDLKMGAGKIASQCAHAATGMYAELVHGCNNRLLLRRWEQSGQPKIVVTCRNQQEMNKIREGAENVGLPTYVVADAGRTQVASGSRTVLAIGPGPKALVDSVTGKLRLL